MDTTQRDDLSRSFVQRREQELTTEERLRRLEQMDEQEAKLLADERGVAQVQREYAAKEKRSVLADVPLQAVGGVRDAFQQTLDAVHSLAKWSDQWVPDLGGVQLTDPQGNLSVKWVSNTEGMQPAQLPEVAHAETTAGNLTHGVTQFLTGFLGANRLLKGAGVLQGASKATTTARAMVSGGIADAVAFDPQQERLSNLLEEHPALHNPVTAYLAASPHDGEAEGRLKNALEGLGIGAALDGLVLSVRAIKNARAAKEVKELRAQIDNDPMPIPESKPAKVEPLVEAPKAPPKGIAQERETLHPQDSAAGLTRGLPKAPPPETVTRPFAIPAEKLAEFRQRVTDGKLSDAGGLIDFNADTVAWDTMGDNADDLRKLLNTTSETFSEMIGDAKGGVQPLAETQRLASQLGMKAEDASKLFADARGNGGLAARVMAADKLLLASAQRLRDLARKAADTATATGNDYVALERHLEMHAGLQAEVKGARTEVARALHAMRAMKEAAAVNFDEFANVAEQLGKRPQNKALAEKLAKATDVREVNKIARKSVGRRMLDVALEVYINGLLSSVKTLSANTIGGAVKLTMGAGERYIAAGIGAARRAVGQDVAGVSFREANASAYGALMGMQDALKLPLAGLAKATAKSVTTWDKTTVQNFLKENAQEFGSVYRAAATGAPQLEKRVRLGADLNAIRMDATGKQGGAYALAQGVNALGEFIRLPGRALLTSDELLKAVAYRQELHALAYRKAAQEADAKGLIGKARQEHMTSAIEGTLRDPPEELHLASIDHARVQTFQENLGEVAQKGADILNRAPMLKFIVPFYRTPVNILKQGLADYAPTGALKLLRSEWRAKIAAGGPEADLVLARLTLGTSIFAGTLALAQQGMVSGGGPKGPNTSRLSGIKPYSVKVGEQWYQYNRLDPIGMLMGLAADINEGMSRGIDPDGDGEGITDALAIALTVVSKNVLSKTWTQGVNDALNALNDPERYGGSWVKRNVATMLTPYSSALRAAKNEADPITREAVSFLDAWKANLPGFSKSLPAKRDMLGRPMQVGEGLGPDWMSPMGISSESADPLDQELARLAFSYTAPPKSIQGVPLDNKEYSRFLELRGQTPLIEGKSLETALRQLIEGDEWRKLSEGEGDFTGGKVFAVKKYLAAYGEAARAQLLEEFPELKQSVIGRKTRAQQVLTGQ